MKIEFAKIILAIVIVIFQLSENSAAEPDKKTSQLMPSSRVSVMLDFRAAPVKEVLTELSRQAGVNIVYADMDDDAAITVYYKGDNVTEALNSIINSGNLSYKKEGNTFTVSQYETKTFDMSVLYESSFDLGNQNTGGAGQVAQTTQGTSGSASSSSFGQSQVYIKSNGFEGFLTKVIDKIKPLLSHRGKITFLPSGVLYVKDTPRTIKDIETLLNVDNSKHKPITLKLSLIRIDFNNENQAGVDWQAAIKGISGIGGIREITIGGNFLPLLQKPNTGTITIKTKNTQDIVKFLSSYGDVKIVHNWQTQALSGTLLPFELTQMVWYSQGSTVQVLNNQTITTPVISSSQVGVKIRLTPTVFKDNKFLINTFVELSSIVGSQSVAGLEFPNIETNMVSIPIEMSANETTTISGFKITSASKSNVGLPILNSIPILRTLFGYTERTDKTSELIVVMSIGD